MVSLARFDTRRGSYSFYIVVFFMDFLTVRRGISDDAVRLAILDWRTVAFGCYVGVGTLYIFEARAVSCTDVVCWVLLDLRGLVEG